MKTQAQIERAERAERKAASLRATGEGLLQASSDEAQQIPLGQPILVGHHSEKKHRAHLARLNSKTRKGVELLRASENVGRGGVAVLANDPEIVVALRAKVAKLEEERATKKAFNKKRRKEGLEALPAYVLSNLGANIRATKKRLAAAIEMADAKHVELEFEGFDYIEDPELVRVQLNFDGRPSGEDRKVLKAHGFRWAPSLGVWQRQLNGAGRYAAKQVALKLFGTAIEEA